MKNNIDNYIKKIDKKINENKVDFSYLKEEHLKKILFYQHERLIHLLVTLFYALFTLIVIRLSYLNGLFIIIFLILFVFLIFYVKYYFYLENHVQYMYKQYDKINDKIKNR